MVLAADQCRPVQIGFIQSMRSLDHSTHSLRLHQLLIGDRNTWKSYGDDKDEHERDMAHIHYAAPHSPRRSYRAVLCFGDLDPATTRLTVRLQAWQQLSMAVAFLGKNHDF
jgi:hypothetical protein